MAATSARSWIFFPVKLGIIDSRDLTNLEFSIIRT